MLNVSFVFAGYENGRPYWDSTQYGMRIVWNGIFWQIINWPYDGTPVNYTDTDIPLTGWQLIDNTSLTATFSVNLGECCFEYSFVNATSGSTLVIKYIDCNYIPQNISVPFGISGSFCATSILASSNTGSYSLTGDLCSNPDTTCRGWVLTGPVTVYYTDCNGIPWNTTTVNSESFDFGLCARSVDAWDNVNNFYAQGYC
jgi:hypothetical protein